MASGSQNMTTFNAKHIVGDSTNVNWANALLHSGRDGKTSSMDTWIFADDYGSASSTYGLLHRQSDDKFVFVGASTDRFWNDLNTGDTYVAGKLGIGYNPETSGNTYKLYVNGTGYFTGSVTINKDTPELVLKNTNTATYSIIRLNTPASDSAGIIFMNAASRTDDGGGNLMTIRNNVGDLRLDDNTAVTGTLTVGIRGTSTAPSAITSSDRIVITPYYHTGGPWKITSKDDASNAYLSLYYSTTETARMQHNGALLLCNNISFTNSGTAFRGINYGTMGDNDQWRIGGAATAANAGYMELATADDGNEPVYVRQYTGVFTTLKRTLTLLDGNGNSSFPGNITCIGAPQAVTATNMAFNGGIQLREVGAVGNTQSAIEYGPRISFHWGNRVAKSITLHSNGTFYFRDQNGTTRSTIDANVVGALTGNVTGNCSGSSGSCTGNAATASKLGTATVGGSNRGIYLNAGTATAVSWYYDFCSISGGNKANYPWHRFATCTTGAGQWTDKSVIVILHSRFDGGAYGMVKLSIRTNSTNSAKSTSAVWIYRKGFAVDDIKISAPAKKTGTDETINAYIKCSTYPRMTAYILEGSNLGWSLVSSNEPDNTTASDKKGGTEINASVSGHDATDGATVSYANSAGSCTGNAATATKLQTARNLWGNSFNGTAAIDGSITMGSAKAIKFVASAGDTETSTPTALTYGRLQAYGTLCINANTDNSGTEYVILTAGKGMSSKGADGLEIGSTTLKFLGTDVVRNSGTWSISVTGSSASCTGNAATATALGTNAGNANTPVYFTGGKPSACNNKLGAQSANGYWGMGSADNAFNVWIRTTSLGIIPYQSGGKGSGHCGLGTSSWYFSTAYIDTITSNKTYGAVWNDIAECRHTVVKEAGRVVVENESGIMELSSKRMQSTGRIISDTYGYCMGEPANDGTPIAIAGRVLVYPYRKLKEYNLGDCVCAAPNGTVDIMTREEIKEYPDRIIGTVSEIPTYEIWSGGAQNGKDDIPVNGRIWIYVR